MSGEDGYSGVEAHGGGEFPFLRMIMDYLNANAEQELYFFGRTTLWNTVCWCGAFYTSVYLGGASLS